MIKGHIFIVLLMAVVFSATAQAEIKEKTQAEIEEEEIKNRAYEISKDQALPMSTDQIIDFLGTFRESQKASIDGQAMHPDKRVRIESIPLDPGENIPTVYVAQGYVTTISFLDATGYGWPVIDVVSGGNFTITPPEQDGHIIRITPNVRFGFGNLSIRLKGLDFPITLNIEVDDEFVDYRFDAKVPMKGPNSQVSILEQSNIASAGDSALSSILEGVIPTGLTKLEIIEGSLFGTAIYQKDDTVYIRTGATLLSPRWKSSASISEGIKVYTIKASPVLLFSKDGEIIKLKLKLLKEER